MASFVYSLICKRDLAMGERCLRSLLRCCKDDIELRVYSDGSLDADDQRRLEDALGDRATVIRRQDMEEQVCQALKPFPECWRARSVHPMFCKLFDIPIHAAGRYAYVDTDVLFLRAFRGLHREDVQFAHMRDIGQGDGFGWKRRLLGQVRPLYRCNAGFLFVGSEVFSLETIEELYGRLGSAGVYFEQGTWGILGSRVKAGCFSPRQIAMPWPTCRKYTARDLPVALHFIGNTRTQMQGVIDHYPFVEEEPLQLDVTPAQQLNPLRALYDSSRKSLWRFGLKTQ